MTNVSGLAGQPLTLECDANGFPVPEVVWLKDGHLVGISGEVGMGGFCVCSGGIGRWQRDVTCLWGCLGSGAGGNWTLVTTAPLPLFPPCSYSLPLDSCPQIPEAGDHHLLDGARSLYFPRIQESDSGLYTCRAENQAGSAQRDFSLAVFSE